jgi:NAD-dependent dihydropyrimidine dehydrogenase PreA subunit
MTAVIPTLSRPTVFRPRLSLVKSILLTLPMMLLSFVLLTQGSLPEDPLLMGSLVFTWTMFNAAFFLMLWSGRTDRFRAPLFVLIALAMVIFFSATIGSERGNVAITEENAINGEVPFCHMVIPMVLLPAITTGTIIFPGSLLTGFAGIAFMIVLWLGSSIALGRGFCSWMCFYGGYDDGCSRLLKRPILRKIDRRWVYFPFAMLIFIVLASALTLSPTYCEWFCPFKAVTEYAAVTNLISLIQTIIFVALFIGLVIVLPILTRRRVQCGLFCPMGAMQSLTNKVNIFDVRIDTEKCTGCQKCINTCPTFSIDENSLKTGRMSITCTKCGKCIDACPKGAISFHIKGTEVGKHPTLARVLFLYPAFLLMVAFSGGIVTMAIYYLLKLVTTGSMI